MVALYLDHPILDCSAGTACCFELFAKLRKCSCVQCQPLDQGYTFALAAFGFSGDAYDAVRHGRR